MANEPINEDKTITKNDVKITVEFPLLDEQSNDFVEIDLDDLKNLTLPDNTGASPGLQNNDNNPRNINTVVPGDSRAILTGNIPVENNSAPSLVSADTVTLAQDPFTNPNPPVIASNAGKIHNINNAVQSEQPGVTIGNSAGIRNINFLTGQPTNNNTINNVASVDDSTAVTTNQDATQGPVIGNTSDFLRTSTTFQDIGTGTGGNDGSGEDGRPSLNRSVDGEGSGGRPIQGEDSRVQEVGDGNLGAFTVLGDGGKDFPTDWRVRIGLLPDSSVLYKDPEYAGEVQTGGSSYPGINVLAPLVATDGVLFPYTPSIQMTYAANYESAGPTHTNYPSRFYTNSEVRDVQINATFTAQSTFEADYLMAVIHFFKSATKMFYGRDDNKGQPPPLLQITGLGQHQFNGHKCVLQQFNYTLPEDVDYVRTSAGVGGSGSITASQNRARLQNKSDQFGLFGMIGRASRLLGIGANKGAMPTRMMQSNTNADLARAGTSYVPSKIELSLTLMPVVSRKEQTGQYSTRDYASGINYGSRGHW